MPEQTAKLITIGRITKAHGVRGEMALDFYSDDAALLEGVLFLDAPERSSGQAPEQLPGQLPGQLPRQLPGQLPEQALKPASEKKAAAPQARASSEAGGGKLRPVRLNSLRWHHGNPLITLEGVKDRTEAELLRNRSLLIPESKLPELSDGELYLHALIGLQVYVMGVRLAGVSETEPLGELAWVDQSSGQEIWGIVTPGGKEVLFPAVDEFIVGFDMKNNSVRIAPPEGLLELYLSDQSQS